MTQFDRGVKDMMTNALPGMVPRVIGFLLHQNQRFIDHDKVRWPEHLFINDWELRPGTAFEERFF